MKYEPRVGDMYQRKTNNSVLLVIENTKTSITLANVVTSASGIPVLPPGRHEQGNCIKESIGYLEEQKCIYLGNISELLLKTLKEA
jgi:hypothetical protein